MHNNRNILFQGIGCNKKSTCHLSHLTMCFTQKVTNLINSAKLFKECIDVSNEGCIVRSHYNVWYIWGTGIRLHSFVNPHRNTWEERCLEYRMVSTATNLLQLSTKPLYVWLYIPKALESFLSQRMFVHKMSDCYIGQTIMGEIYYLQWISAPKRCLCLTECTCYSSGLLIFFSDHRQ